MFFVIGAAPILAGDFGNSEGVRSTQKNNKPYRPKFIESRPLCSWYKANKITWDKEKMVKEGSRPGACIQTSAIKKETGNNPEKELGSSEGSGD